jgi:hypothetical protein
MSATLHCYYTAEAGSDFGNSNWVTVSMVLVFMTSTIDARENREVVTINIPGAFLHATNKDYVIM